MYVRHVMLCIQNVKEKFRCLGAWILDLFFFKKNLCARINRKEGSMDGWVNGRMGVRCFATLGWWVARRRYEDGDWDVEVIYFFKRG